MGTAKTPQAPTLPWGRRRAVAATQVGGAAYKTRVPQGNVYAATMAEMGRLGARAMWARPSVESRALGGTLPLEG
jgi:hypothetical protein